MLANVFHWVDNQYAFGVGANWLQWITSVVAFAGWSLYFHTRFGPERCQHCWRKGTVPVKNTVHMRCKVHAVERGNTH